MRLPYSIFKTTVKKNAQGCQSGIAQFLGEDILNNQNPPKNFICTTLPRIPPLPPDYYEYSHITGLSILDNHGIIIFKDFLTSWNY